MSQDQIDYAAVLEDLKKRREKLDAAIAAISLIVGEVAAEAATANDAPLPTTVQTDAFFNMGTRAAIRKYLSIVKRPQKAIAIRKALQDGGIHTVSTDFYAVVLTTLKRNEEFVQLQNKEWGLSEWYGGRIRKRGKVEDGKKEGAEDQAEESGD